MEITLKLRLQFEYDALVEKVRKLKKYLEENKTEVLKPENGVDTTLLISQLNAMSCYLGILALRIDRIEREQYQKGYKDGYTDEEIQKMQDLESAEIEKAYEIGLREGRKKGEWIDETFTDGIEAQKCSACGYIEYALYRPNFCPECGADMRGTKND